MAVKEKPEGESSFSQGLFPLRRNWEKLGNGSNDSKNKAKTWQGRRKTLREKKFKAKKLYLYIINPNANIC